MTTDDLKRLLRHEIRQSSEAADTVFFRFIEQHKPTEEQEEVLQAVLDEELAR